MKTLTYEKPVLASRLQEELLAAGVSSSWTELGEPLADPLTGEPGTEPVTISRSLVVAVIEPVKITANEEHIPAGAASVEIVVADDQDEAVVAGVVAAHNPAPAPTSAPDPLVPASVAVNTAVAAAIATVAITSPKLTTAQRDAIEKQVRAQVQAVVDDHLTA